MCHQMEPRASPSKIVNHETITGVLEEVEGEFFLSNLTRRKVIGTNATNKFKHEGTLFHLYNGRKGHKRTHR